MSRRLAADVGWLWVGYVGRSIAYLGLVVVLTTGLGPAGFGALSLFLAVTLGVAQLAGGWPFLAVPVLSGRGRTIAAAYRPAAVVASAATAVTLAIAVPVLAVLSDSSAVTASALCVYAVALVGLQGVYAVLQTEGRMAGIALAQTTERVVGLIAIGVAVATVTLTVYLAEVLLAITAALVCIAAYAVLERRQALFRPHLGWRGDHTVRTVLGAVGAMGIVSVCAYGVASLDIFILAAFRSDRDVGIYSLAYQVFTFTVQIGSLWVVATLPRHARSSAEGRPISEQLPLGRMLAGTRIWGAMTSFAAVAAAFLLPLVFGEEFRGAVVPLTILLSGTALGIGYFAATPVLVASGRTVTLAKLSGVAVAINLGLDLVLVPTIGLNGPAIATVAQTVFSTAAVLAVTLGPRSGLGVLVAGLPASLGVAALALGPTEPLPVAVALLGGLASLALGLRSLRANRPTADGLPATGGAREG